MKAVAREKTDNGVPCRKHNLSLIKAPSRLPMHMYILVCERDYVVSHLYMDVCVERGTVYLFTSQILSSRGTMSSSDRVLIHHPEILELELIVMTGWFFGVSSLQKD